MQAYELVINTVRKLMPENSAIVTILPNMDLKEDIGLDSIRILRLIIELERSIGKDFVAISPDLDLMGVRTVGDIVTILNQVNDLK